MYKPTGAQVLLPAVTRSETHCTECKGVIPKDGHCICVEGGVFHPGCVEGGQEKCDAAVDIRPGNL